MNKLMIYIMLLMVNISIASQSDEVNWKQSSDRNITSLNKLVRLGELRMHEYPAREKNRAKTVYYKTKTGKVIQGWESLSKVLLEEHPSSLSESTDKEQLAKLANLLIQGPYGFVISEGFLSLYKENLPFGARQQTLDLLLKQEPILSAPEGDGSLWLLSYSVLTDEGGLQRWRISMKKDTKRIISINVEQRFVGGQLAPLPMIR